MLIFETSAAGPYFASSSWTTSPTGIMSPRAWNASMKRLPVKNARSGGFPALTDASALAMAFPASPLANELLIDVPVCSAKAWIAWLSAVFALSAYSFCESIVRVAPLYFLASATRSAGTVNVPEPADDPDPAEPEDPVRPQAARPTAAAPARPALARNRRRFHSIDLSIVVSVSLTHCCSLIEKTATCLLTAREARLVSVFARLWSKAGSRPGYCDGRHRITAGRR